MFDRVRVVVLGGGDLASGVIYRLHRAGFPVIVTELAAPLLVRRTVAYGSAVYEGEIIVEGITARLVDSPEEATVKSSPHPKSFSPKEKDWLPSPSAAFGRGGEPQVRWGEGLITEGKNQFTNIIQNNIETTLQANEIPVLIDPDGQAISQIQPTVIVDARMAKRNLGITVNAAPLVIGLGPGFTAGQDVHAVIETNRGHNLGRVIWQGAAEPDTGTPGSVKGHTATRVLRAPEEGHVQPHFAIGDTIRAGQIIAEVNDRPIIAQFDGVLRGLIHESVKVTAGMKVGDLDPRLDQKGFTISDKALAIGGGVVEAVLFSPVVRQRIIVHETASGT